MANILKLFVQVAQSVEHKTENLGVASSILVLDIINNNISLRHIAQLVEQTPFKRLAPGSNPGVPIGDNRLNGMIKFNDNNNRTIYQYASYL